MTGAEKDAPEKSVQDFLQRWSRRKLGSVEAEQAAPSAPAELPPTTDSQPLPPPAEVAAETPAAFDIASLPPIESIDATTDIRAFLAPGVPADLARAALRRAWTSDPTIRDFVGLAENQWDFTDPEAVPGFGSLDFKEDEVRAMVSRLFGEIPRDPPQNAADNTGTPAGDRAESAVLNPQEPDRQHHLSASAAVTPGTDGTGGAGGHGAPQNVAGTSELEAAQRKHGTALPK